MSVKNANTELIKLNISLVDKQEHIIIGNILMYIINGSEWSFHHKGL